MVFWVLVCEVLDVISESGGLINMCYIFGVFEVMILFSLEIFVWGMNKFLMFVYVN